MWTPHYTEEPDLNHPQLRDCVFLMPFNEFAGGYAHEYMNNGISEGRVNGATWTTAGTTQCLDFDGTDDYVAVDSHVLDLPELTCSVWVWFDAFDDTDARIFAGSASMTNSWGFAYFGTGADTELEFGHEADIHRRCAYSSLSGLNQWHHCLVLYRGTGSTGVDFYLDGVHLTDQNGNAFGYYDSGNDCWIGYRQDNTNAINGKMSNYRIYSRALSPSECYDLYANPWAPWTEKEDLLPFHGSIHGGATSFQAAWAHNTNLTIGLI